MGIVLLSLIAILPVNGAESEVKVTVRTVDRYAMPLPGIEITVQEVKGCGDSTQVSGTVIHRTTEPEGQAVFNVTTDKPYLIRTSAESGLEARESCLPIRSSSHANRYVQLQLRPDPRNTVTIIHPSVGRVAPLPRRLPPASFVGVYLDALNRVYEVSLADDTKGLTVESSDGRLMTFATRVGDVFTGSSGRVAFAVVAGRVTGLQLTPVATSARRLEERK